MYRSKYRNKETTCQRCGRVVDRDNEFYPECSSGCVEWVVDRNQEERHGIYFDDRDDRW